MIKVLSPDMTCPDIATSRAMLKRPASFNNNVSFIPAGGDIPKRRKLSGNNYIASAKILEEEVSKRSAMISILRTQLSSLFQSKCCEMCDHTIKDSNEERAIATYIYSKIQSSTKKLEALKHQQYLAGTTNVPGGKCNSAATRVGALLYYRSLRMKGLCHKRCPLCRTRLTNTGMELFLARADRMAYNVDSRMSR
mmetsp:Transcript_19513/g.32099  ORF Transcript_19513/g.32099 Transcript_19513/m.32099 type:complete len:195 (-) Transcript_19513:902-1486(-)